MFNYEAVATTLQPFSFSPAKGQKKEPGQSPPPGFLNPTSKGKFLDIFNCIIVSLFSLRHRQPPHFYFLAIEMKINRFDYFSSIRLNSLLPIAWASLS